LATIISGASEATPFFERLRASEATPFFEGDSLLSLTSAYQRRCGSVKTGFTRAVRPAGLGHDVMPPTLRCTAATWLMPAGVDKWEAAGFPEMSVEMPELTSGSVGRGV
jgi:hypothetical protein